MKKRYLLPGVLAVAIPGIARAQDPTSYPAVVWDVRPGLSTSASTICALVGDLGRHRALALIADSASPERDLILLLDDGRALPRPQASASTLMITAPGAPPLSIPGTTEFGQFKTTLQQPTSGPFLHLFEAKPNMTLALDGETPIPVNLLGTTRAAQAMERCEEEHDIPQPTVARVRVARGSRTRLRVASAHRHHTRIALATAPLHAPPPATLPSPAPAEGAGSPGNATPVDVTQADTAPAAAPASTTAPVAAATLMPTEAPPSVDAPPLTQHPLQTPSSFQLLLAKAIETQFVAVIEDGKASYQNTSDKILSLAARADRATDLCTLLGREKNAEDWSGTIDALSTSAQGWGILSVKLAYGIELTNAGPPTSGNDFLIDPTSDLFQAVSKMHVGDEVTFSGQFFESDADCIQELSGNQDQAMASPVFLIQFTSIGVQP